MFPGSRISLVTLISLSLLAAPAAGVAQSRPQSVDRSQFQGLKGVKPFERWLWEFEQRAYPLDRIPEGAKDRAFQRMRQAKAAQSPRQPKGALTLNAITGSVWQSLGPKPIFVAPAAGGQTNPPSPVSGRVADVAVDPNNANHWLIGAAQGGIWQTFDGGSTWSPTSDDQPTLAMGAIAFAPSSPNIVYAGTGEAVFASDAYGGACVLKSLNGGSSWSLVASSPFLKMAFSDIKVDPATPNVLLAAGARGLGVLRTSLGGDPAAQGGIYKSTNGGAGWSRKLEGVATDLEVNPFNFNIQYAGIGEIFGSPPNGAQNGLYRSFDGGETWSIIPGPWNDSIGGVGRVELAISPSNPEVLYVSIQDAINSVGADQQLLGVWRTTNASSPTPSWSALPSPSSSFPFFTTTQWWYDHDATVAPSDPNTLYLGGVAFGKFDGINWTDITTGVTSGIHADQHSLAWVGNRLIVGNDGGVWSTTDGGSTWTNHNSELSITQFYLGSMHPTDPNFVIGGSQDNGTTKWSGTLGWDLVLTGDGASSAISTANPNTHWALSAQRLLIFRTTDAGFTRPLPAADSGIDKAGVPFIAEMEKCPHNDNVFIAGTNNLWKTTDFFSAAPAAPTWTVNGPEMGVGIVSMAFAPSDGSCNTYAYATSNGEIRLTTNGGVNWNDIDSANSVPGRFITDIAFDPTNSNVLYLTLSGFDEGTPTQPGHVFKTTNSLAPSPTWSNISTPVNLPHNALVVDSSAPNNLFVGTDLGVWNSTNGGTTWTVTGTGMPYVAVFDLQLNATTGRLIAFTHGRGAFAMLQPVLPPPTGLVATAVSQAQVNITWTAPGVPVDHYELQRSQSVAGPFSTIASPSTTNFTDTNATGLGGSVAYLYRVRAVDAQGNVSSFSNIDHATTMSYTDDPLVAASTVIKAQHINELRVAVNAVRTAAVLPQASWTDASLPGVFIKAVHITELRQNLDQALQVIGLATPIYTDQTLSAGLLVKRAHVEEIRQTVK